MKKIIFILLIFFELWGISNKNSKYRNEIADGRLLKENRQKLEEKIENLQLEREEKNKKIRSDFEQIQILSKKISLLSLKNESEFKKMIYLFTRESGLKMKEVSKAESLWERNGYRLKYIHFTLYGTLNDFGKFLYFINKSRKFIDTSSMYISLEAENFKISLGFIEKDRITIKD